MEPKNSTQRSDSFERFLAFYHRLAQESSRPPPSDSELPTEIEKEQGEKIPNPIPTSSSMTDSSSNGDNGGGRLQLNLEGMEFQKLLECPVCDDILLPPITICESGHAVCNSCKENCKSCPLCRGKFTEVRNRFAEELLEKCLVRCKFAESGCQVVLTGRKLSVHHQVCNFRPVVCRQCEVEILYHEFLDHLRNEENIETHRAAEGITGFDVDKEELIRNDGGDVAFSFWEPTWIHAHGRDFFCFLETLNSHWWIWVGGYATPEECERFTCSITVWNKETKTEMGYVGTIHPIRTPPEDVFASGRCLSFLDEHLKKNLMYRGGIDVLVRIDREEGRRQEQRQ